MTDIDIAAVLKPCPFCGAGETRVDEAHLAPRMNQPGALISVTIRHWCERQPGAAHVQLIAFTGRDHEQARAAWDRRAPITDTAAPTIAVKFPDGRVENVPAIVTTDGVKPKLEGLGWRYYKTRAGEWHATRLAPIVEPDDEGNEGEGSEGEDE